MLLLGNNVLLPHFCLTLEILLAPNGCGVVSVVTSSCQRAYGGLSWPLFNINNCLSAKPDPAQLEQAVCLILGCHRAISISKSVEFASWFHFLFPKSTVVIPPPSKSDTNASIKADSYTHAKVAPHSDSKGKQGDSSTNQRICRDKCSAY